MSILIETPRLRMRQFTMDDVEAVYEFSTNESVTCFTGDVGFIQTRQDAEHVIRDIWIAEYEKYGYARYALIHKEENRVIGFCGLKYEPELGSPDIGYRMLPDYWGKGLGTEACQAILNYAKEVLGLGKIVAEVVIENIASNQILQKLGFIHKNTYLKKGFSIHYYELVHS